MKEFDNSAKAFYRQLFENWGMMVETERVVFSRERTIDLVVTCNDADQERLQTTVFSHFKRLNAIELKGINDPLTEIDYNRIMMRAWGLGALKPKKAGESDDHFDSEEAEELEDNSDTDESSDENDTNESQLNRCFTQRTVTIVCLTKPVKILTTFKDKYQFVKTDEDGIYHCQGGLSQWIICPSELALIPKNYPLLPLAKGPKLAQFVDLCFQQGLFDYLRLIIDIGRYTDPDAILQKILEVQQMTPQISDETLAYADEFFRKKPELMWKLSAFQEAAQQAFQQAAQQAAQQAEQRGLQQGVQQGIQKALIHQLRCKFVSIPDSVVQKIEATSDIEQLNTWLSKFIIAKSLADTGLLDSEPKQ
jgi:hypothetical protein